MRAVGLGLLLIVCGVAGCESAVKAPFDTGVCYHVGFPPGGEAGADTGVRFNVVARNQPQIEFCAARLEEMRLNFLRMGGSNREVIGAYQGRFIFVDRAGVSFGKTLDGVRFVALARTGDGRLAIPGAIQRDIDGTPVAVAAPPPAPNS